MRVQFNNICPEDEIFVKAFLNELDLRKKEELITHILACPRCRLKFQTMKQVKNELKKTGELREEKFSRLKISLKYAGVAAGILLVLSASLFILSKFKKDGILRGSNKEKLLLIEPVGKISTPPSLFKWTSLKNADSYIFNLIDDELNTIISSQALKTQIILPENIKAKLVRGKTYIWNIEAISEENLKLDSASISFEIE